MNLTQVIDIKERIATGEHLAPHQRTFVLDCINEAFRVSVALARTRAVLGDSDPLKVFEIELDRERRRR